MTIRNYYSSVLMTLSLICTTNAALAVDTQVNEYKVAAQTLVADLSLHKTTVFSRMVDADTIIAEAIDGLTLDNRFKSSFTRSMKTTIETKLANKLVSQMPEHAYARLLRVKPESQKTLALIRLDYGDHGTAYLDLHLQRMPAGEIRIVDWYDYSTGQTYTKSLRQIVGLLSPTPTIVGKVFDLVTHRTSDIRAISKLIELSKTQKFREMVEQFLAMDEALRKNRMLNIIVVQAANQTQDDALYHKTLANLDRYFSDDPTMTFLLLDYYFLEKNYARVDAALAQVQQTFGIEDAALTALKANTLLSRKKYDGAIRESQRAIAIEPEYELSYWTMFNALVAEKHFARAVAVAKDLESRFGYDMGPQSLATNASFIPFAQSAEYQQWWRATHGKPSH